MTTRDSWITSGILSGVITFAQGKLIDDMLDTVSMPSVPITPVSAHAPAAQTKTLKTTGLGKAVAVVEGQRITVARARALEFASETGSFAQFHLRDALGIRTELARDLMAWLIREDCVFSDGFDGDVPMYRISGTGRAILEAVT